VARAWRANTAPWSCQNGSSTRSNCIGPGRGFSSNSFAAGAASERCRLAAVSTAVLHACALMVAPAASIAAAARRKPVTPRPLPDRCRRPRWRPCRASGDSGLRPFPLAGGDRRVHRRLRARCAAISLGERAPRSSRSRVLPWRERRGWRSHVPVRAIAGIDHDAGAGPIACRSAATRAMS